MSTPEYDIKVRFLSKSLEKGYGMLKRRAWFGPHMLAAALFFSLLALFIVSETVFYWPADVKIIFLGFLLVLCGYVYFRNRKKNKSDSDFKSFYRRFGSFSGIKELNYALDLLTEKNAPSQALLQAAIQSNLEQVDADRFREHLKYFLESDKATRNYRFYGLTLLSGIVLIGVTGLFFNDSILRTAYFWKNFSPPNPYTYQITPGNVTLEQGSSFSVKTMFTGHPTAKILTLRVKTDVEKEYRKHKMELTDSTFQSVPFSINNDLEYYIEMDGFRSPVYTAEVQLRPRFSELTAQIIPPAYTKTDTLSKSYPFSKIEALQGSDIRFTGIANKIIRNAGVATAAGLQPLQYKDDNVFTYNMTVANADTLNFELEDENGLTNNNPFRIVISPIADEYPFIEILDPASSFEMVEPKSLEITYKATDDFGLTNATLFYELHKAYVEMPKRGKAALPKPLNGTLQRHNWSLKELGLNPLDRIDFWVEVTDNDAYNGFKKSSSQVITLSVPSLIDYFESLNEDESDIGSSLDDISESFKEMQNAYDDFKEGMKENPEVNYEQHKQLEEVKQKQEKIEQQIRELNEKFDEIKKELNENELLSEETRNAYKELKDLMQEINDPALQEALQKLQEQLNRFNPEQLRRAMENVEFNEQAYKERLNRTIELFKRLKLISDLEKLANSFEDKARQEENIKNNPPNDEELSKKRDQDLEQLEKLQQALDKLDDYTGKKNEKIIEEYKNETEKDLQNLQNQIREDSDMNPDGASNKSENSRNNAKTYEQEYGQMAARTRKAMEGASAQEMNLNIAGLRHILYNLLNLSNEQEDLVVAAQTTENSSNAFIDFARNQQNVQRIFGVVADSLTQIAAEIPQFSNDIGKKKLEVKAQLERSVEQMAERNTRNSSVASRQVYGGINDISYMIANLLEQIQEQGEGLGSGGEMSLEQLIERLGETGKNQQELNQQIQNMINDLQGERLSQDQMQRLEQIARQQNKIRKQLQEMQRNGNLSGDKIGSDLQRMADEMEDIINDIRGGAVDRTLVRRQQNILSRMLQSEKSLQEREEEEKRESTTGDIKLRSIPPEITLEELEKQIRTRLNDPNFTKYSPDYQRLIERYFELLFKLEKENIP